MPVILAQLADPFDLVLQGEELRSQALAVPVDGPGFPTPFLRVAANERLVANIGQNENQMLGMMGGDVDQLQGGGVLVYEFPITANGWVCTPCGALIFLQRFSTSIPYFVQATRRWVVTGTTRDAGGSPLANCRVVEFEVGRLATGEMPVVGETVSDGSGVYSVEVPLNTLYQAIAYKPGSPDVAGITRADVVPDLNN